MTHPLAPLIAWGNFGDREWGDSEIGGNRGRERPEGPSLAIGASTSGLRASKSGDITFSCGCLLILKHYTLRAALSSVLNPGGSERR